MASSLATLALIQLLPLLALFASPVSATHDGKRSVDKRQQNVTPLTFQQVGDMGISAQMMFYGTGTKVYVLDKVENNPVTVNGKTGTHPAWAVEYDYVSNTYRAMDVQSNTFCAGGGVLGNGTFVAFGGNQPVTTNGIAVSNAGAYKNTDGGTAIRMLNPCTDQKCNWIEGYTDYTTNGNTKGYLQMTSRRWYPTVEVLEDGTMIVIGGDKNGGYVNTAAQDNPTYEFFPPRTPNVAINLDFLSETLPVNLYALTWLLPSGKLFMQANRRTILYDYNEQETTDLPDMPYATRVYPASAATAMLPLIPDNNYSAGILFCGGSNPPQWGNDGTAGYNVTAVPADSTCVRIYPDAPNPTYQDDDYMFEGRSMGQFVMLPDGTFWMANGVAMGTAGYGDDRFSIGQSYGQSPLYMPAIYNHTAPLGQRWNRTGLTASRNERMYHSTAILLPDSSILISGSNPNKDFTTEQWRTRTDVERWFPWYYNNPRPQFASAPSTISYGGQGFDVSLGTTDMAAVSTAKVVIIRPGFNTHAIGFGQRMIQLNSTYTVDMRNNTATLHVAQIPSAAGPRLFQPGPALMFLVVQGVPSEGKAVMIGNGKIGTQPTSTDVALPANTVLAVQPSASSGGASGTNGAASGSSSRAAAGRVAGVTASWTPVVGGVAVLAAVMAGGAGLLL
ncbi:glyoxal oxidase N-terminus-domain-containing protein [Dioszegia hungarica]|uniref:Glyoxal oxidase N-terminus-domain-containing protein n=1 Tax=Dioszegia hungarica TaxID=4972 RepID=A0AA38LVF7_9TREE|nr:glyoxal oxidase N-terminus-domain-containing protein [Dioszegia hungarica]KAI9637230.1 glyoxal oxidase N-terminus-domain-containing protein [Dioszegia hungarica]